MTTSSAVAATGGLVIVGTWAQKKPIDARRVIGVAIYAFGMALISNANDEFAARFATLVLVGALFVYAPQIAKWAGLTR